MDSSKRVALFQGVAQGSLSYKARLRATYPANMVGLWMLDESAGRLAANSAPGAAIADFNLIDNGDFETAGAGGADVFAAWQESVSDGAITDETSIVHGGGHAAKLTAGAAAATYIRAFSYGESPSTIKVYPGLSLTLSFWTRGDGTNQGRYSIWNASDSSWLKTATNTGVPGTAYQQVTYAFTVPAGCYEILANFVCSTVNGGICSFDDVSLTADSFTPNAIYAPSGITYGQAGIIPGHTAVEVDGNDTYAQHGSKGWSQLANPNKGAAIAWGKVDGAGRWTDASTFRYLWHPKSRNGSGTVYMVMGKNSTNHQLVWRRRVVSAIFEKTYTFSPSGTLDWFCMGMVWDLLSTPQRIAGFLYTHEDKTWQTIFDEEPASGNENWDLGTYPLDDLNCVLLAGSTAAQEWIGSGGPIAEWAGIVLSEAQLRKVMQL